MYFRSSSDNYRPSHCSEKSDKSYMVPGSESRALNRGQAGRQEPEPLVSACYSCIPGSDVLRSIGIAAFPLLDASVRFILREPVGLLYLPKELIAPTCDLIQVIISELAPLFLDPAFQLLPVALCLIPVHGFHLQVARDQMSPRQVSRRLPGADPVASD